MQQENKSPVPENWILKYLHMFRDGYIKVRLIFKTLFSVCSSGCRFLGEREAHQKDRDKYQNFCRCN